MNRSVGGFRGVYGAEQGAAEQRRAFTSGAVPVAVYGLGKIGLPLAAVLADVTGNTIGVDVDESVVRTVGAGGCHVKREPGLPELVAEVVERGALRAEADPVDAAEAAAVHVLVVPTLLTPEEEPDLSAFMSAVRDVGEGLSRGDLVVVESTVPPRTTADRVVPVLSATSGLAPGTFGAAVCPERTVSGQALADIRGTHPKVVGGVDHESTRAAALVYGEVTDNEVIEVADAATASAVKVFEGVYRDVNIALANELALLADRLDVDVNDAIDVANSQPFCDVHDPGPGVGGHCIPVYPYFLTSPVDVDSRLISAARDVNDGMPSATVAAFRRILSDHGVDVAGARVLLLGMAYRANVDELRNAPSIPIARRLGAMGATVMGTDPVIGDWCDVGDVERVPLTEVFERDVDLVALLAPHDEFEDLDWDAFDAPVFDGRRAIDPDEVQAAVYSVGGGRA